MAPLVPDQIAGSRRWGKISTTFIPEKVLPDPYHPSSSRPKISQ